ncbi:MAG: HIT family protein [Catonella sp.]
MKDENCIFCKLANGDIPANTVYEDDYLRAIMDASPANKGHIIILPKSHAGNIYELEDGYVEKSFVLAKKIAIALKKLLNCDGINILQNNGEAAGQTVFHFHVHIIPRYKQDNCKITWKQGAYEDGEASEIAKKISSLI